MGESGHLLLLQALSPTKITCKMQIVNSFRTATGFFRLCQASLQDQHQRDRLMQSKSPFQRWQLNCFHSNTVFLKIHNSILYSLHTHKIWKRSAEKYKSYGTLSKTTREACVVRQCTEAQAGMVQGRLNVTHKTHLVTHKTQIRKPSSEHFKTFFVCLFLFLPVGWNMSWEG